ncbi:MAG: anion permease [Proteobacteria bacterium]|nr:anion permease [Pseudomonadota bacterium]
MDEVECSRGSDGESPAAPGSPSSKGCAPQRSDAQGSDAQATQPAPGPRSAGEPHDRARRTRALWLGAALPAGVGLSIALGLPELGSYAQVSLGVFVAAVCAWTFTRLDETFVALGGALVFVIAGLETPRAFFDALGHDMVWLLIGACVVAEGVKQSGLSLRLTAAVVQKTRSISHICYALTGLMVLMALVMPSTSGRAALMVPVFASLSSELRSRSISRALALLIPSVVLLSSVGSLLGAGANVVAADLLQRMDGTRIDYLDWLALGLPFAALSSFLAAWLILRIFLTEEERRQKLSPASLSAHADGELSRAERYVLLTVGALVALWVSEPVHGVNNVVIALLGALVLAAPRFGCFRLGQVLKNVEWGLIVFMAATLKLCSHLLESGAAAWLIQQPMKLVRGADSTSIALALVATTLVSLGAHLVIASRTARVSVLVPFVLLLASAYGANPVTLVFASVAAAGFCLTLPISAKPLALFWQLDRPTYEARDLLRLSAVLGPVHMLLVLGFAFVVWPELVP